MLLVLRPYFVQQGSLQPLCWFSPPPATHSHPPVLSLPASHTLRFCSWETLECSSNVCKHQTETTYVTVKAAEEELSLKSQSSLEVLDHSKFQFL